MNSLLSAGALLAAVLLSPLLYGIIWKTKAFFAGRKGMPLFQRYRDLLKLLGKGAVYSRTVSWVFLLSPPVSLAVMLIACAWLPLGSLPGMFSFRGDFILVIYLMGLSRFFLLNASLDTGSAFEGMGAAREALFSVFTEPAVLLAFAAIMKTAWHTAPGVPGLPRDEWTGGAVILALAAVSLFILALSENARIPVDDPATHLELTMIHEAMILDYSGPDLAFIEYAAGLKLWFFFALMADVLLPQCAAGAPVQALMTIGCVFLLAALTGVVESIMARLPLLHVPHLLGSALAFSMIAVLLGEIL